MEEPMKVRSLWIAAYIVLFLLLAGGARAEEIPRPVLKAWVQACAQVHQIDPALLWAVMRVESGDRRHDIRFGPIGRGKIYSGPCGLKRSCYGKEIADNPWLNVAAGAETLARLLRKTGGNETAALRIYNPEATVVYLKAIRQVKREGIIDGQVQARHADKIP